MVMILGALVWVWALIGLDVVHNDVDFHDVEIVLGDGPDVPALLVAQRESPDQLVVAVHRGLASKETVLGFCYAASSRGSDCLAVDLDGHGASTRPVSTFDAGGCVTARTTLAAVLSTVRADGLLDSKRSYRRVRVVGHALGASLACSLREPEAVFVGQDCPGAGSRNLGGLPNSTGWLSRVLTDAEQALQPWTPSILEGIANAVGPGEPVRPEVRYSVLLPFLSLAGGVVVAWWVTVLLGVYGLGGRRGAFSRRWRGAVVGSLAAEVWIVVFVVCSHQTLGYPLPSGIDDVLLGLVPFAVAMSLVVVMDVFCVSPLWLAGVVWNTQRWRRRGAILGGMVGMVVSLVPVGMGVVALSAIWMERQWCPGTAAIQVLPVALACALVLPLMCVCGRTLRNPEYWSPWATASMLSILSGYGLVLLLPTIPMSQLTVMGPEVLAWWMAMLPG